jgi:type VI protein secretion system component Hcp
LSVAATTGGTGAGTGKPSFKDLTVGKGLDGASGQLFTAVFNLKAWDSGKLELFGSAGSGTVAHTYDLTNVNVLSLRDHATGETSTSPVQEEITLHATRYAQSDGGNSACWDVPTNTPC